MPIRSATIHDVECLSHVLYQAVTWRSTDARPRRKDVPARPEVARYLDGWPGPAGHGYSATAGEVALGRESGLPLGRHEPSPDGMCIALIPSPLTGPGVWAPVSRALQARGVATLVIDLEDSADDGRPYWMQHVASAARQLARLPDEHPVVLVGHSGAGPLLPAIGAALTQTVAGYLLVDAGLPIPGTSRLADIEAEEPEFGAQLRRELEAGGLFPTWTDEDLAEIIPDTEARRTIVAGLRPRPLAFFSEILPQVNRVLGAPCGYIRFSAAYDRPAAQARAWGWRFRAFEAGHFHMVVDPESVATAVLDIVREWGER